MTATPDQATKTSCIPFRHLAPKSLNIALQNESTVLQTIVGRGLNEALFIPACMRAEQGFQIDEAFCILIGCPIIGMKCCAACGNVEDEKLPRA